MKYALIVNGEWYATYPTFEQANNALCDMLEASDTDEDFIRYYGHCPRLEVKEIN